LKLVFVFIALKVKGYCMPSKGSSRTFSL